MLNSHEGPCAMALEHIDGKVDPKASPSLYHFGTRLAHSRSTP